MADEVIEHSDLINPDAIPQIGKDAAAALVYVKQLEDGLKGVAAALGKKINTVPTNVAELNAQNAAIEKINAAEKSQIVILNEKSRLAKEEIAYKDRLNKSNKAQADAVKKLAAEEKKKNAASKEEIQLAKLKDKILKYEKGSYDQLSAKLAYFTKRRNELSAADREGTLVGRFLTEQILKTRNALIELDESTNLHVRKVGAYHLALNKLGKGIKSTSHLLGELGAAFGFDVEVMERIVTIGADVNKILKDVNNAKKLQKASTVESATATQAEIAIEKEKIATDKAATISQLRLNWAVRSHPYFLAVAGLTALVVAIGTYIHFSEEAEEAEKKRSTALDGSIIKDKESRDSHNESIIVLKKSTIAWELFRGEITETQAALDLMTVDYEVAVKKINDETEEKLEEASGFWSEFKAGFKDIGRLFTDEDYGLTYGTGQAEKDRAQIEADRARRLADATAQAEEEKKRKIAEDSKKEQEEIAKNDEDARRRIRQLNNEAIKDTHERNIAIINENADSARLDLINTKMSEYKKAELIKAILAKRDADIAKENLDYYRKNIDAINSAEDKAYYDSLNHQRENLIRKAQEDKKYADLTIPDAIDLANRRIEIEDRLQTDLATIDKLTLELKAKRDIESIKQSELSESAKARIIISIKETLVADEAAIDKKADDEKLDKAETEFEKLATELDRQNAELVAKAEDNAEKLKAIEEKKYSDLQRIRILKAGKNPLLLKEAETQNADEDFTKAMKALDAVHDAGLKEDEDYYREVELLLLEHKKAIEDIDAEFAEKTKKRRDERIDDAIEAERRLMDAVDEGLRYRQEQEDKYMSMRLAQLDSDLRVQESQFNQGLENTLGYEKKQRAEFYAEQRQLEKKRRDQEQALQLAELFLELQKTYADEGAAGAAKALAQTLAAKGVADAIAGSALEGTEDTGSANGRGLDGKGGRLWMLHDNERVLTKDANKKLSGISNDELVDRALAFENLYLPQLAASMIPDEIRHQPAAWGNDALILNGLKEMGDKLEKGLSQIETTKISVDAQKRIIEDIVKGKIHKQIIHERPQSG